jgi:hypothetical protein
MVFDFERMLFRHSIDGRLGLLNLTKSHIDPYISEYVRKLTKELENPRVFN